MAQTAAEQQQLLKQGDHKVAAPPPPPAAPAGIHAEIHQQQQERRPPAAVIANPAPARVEAAPAPKPHAQEVQPVVVVPKPVIAKPVPTPTATPAQGDQYHQHPKPPAAVIPQETTTTTVPQRRPTGQPTPLPTVEQPAQPVGQRPHPAGTPTTIEQTPVTQQQQRQPIAANAGEYQQNGDWRGRHHQGWNPNAQPQWGQIQMYRQENQPWGWQNQDVYRQGWDSRFFEQADPNCDRLRPSINQEADSVAYKLNMGDTPHAAEELNRDLWAMRGDLYAQNELLHETQQEVTGAASSLYLGNWDPVKGSWDTIEAVSPNVPEGYQPQPSFYLQTFPNRRDY